MTTTNKSLPNMTTMKKTAGGRKTGRPAPKPPKRIEARLQGLQTALQANGWVFPDGAKIKAVTAAEACFSFLSSSPFPASPRQLRELLGCFRLEAITEALQVLGRGGFLVVAEEAASPEDTKWRVPANASGKPTLENHATPSADSATWPRSFRLPGLARFYEIDPAALVNHLCHSVIALEGELHRLAFAWLEQKPEEAATLAELLVICEEVAAADGQRTAFDRTPFGQLTPLQALAARVRGEELLERKLRITDLSIAGRKQVMAACARHRVEPGDFLRAILEQALESAASDPTLAPIWAGVARTFPTQEGGTRP